ncbi:helix-turn-helix transcriptional regulator [Staphylococcus simiae]|uniref:helix-turn-helix transcriptional regulator n=1 Tax=Staphylococcus simiae TaxID=308354 RepID=UPI001A9743A3|nr:helix-turn-helix domain-containing protein [Staphylococcus simiae]MBO1198843.1 helix-turn-helix transcriptional regulator [Staphylococcus simiae]MBO1201040.1 helix-turn-helix transcriptional regulator [Staphylococcus simiae]MBO1204039.1 helix-turn-helix transcriptional regulator [Staphylococcus simiae]MBO1211080.1 helix-turn-helix transcriptional regulator [Staphylococcus simiae]MBO1229367.1 helix-turn-helix transcriptional regulator [Staphylococcus simiae]
MADSVLHMLTNNEYATTRCQDGIVLFWPIEDEMNLQKFRKSTTVTDDIFIINHLDVYSINKNSKTIMFYISSDWFTELGFSFFDYHYTANLIKSSYKLKCLLLTLIYRSLEKKPLKDEDIAKIKSIVTIIATEAAMDKETAQNQYNYAYYGDLKEELDYIYEHVHERLTLQEVADELFVSKSNLSSQFRVMMGMGFKKYVDTLKIGESIEILLTSDHTISYISGYLGFSNSSTYAKMFKNYIGVTPNDYRKLSKLNKKSGLQVERLTESQTTELRKDILYYINHYKNRLTDVIHIDVEELNAAKPFQTVIQVNTITEMKLVFLEGIFKRFITADSQVTFFIMPSIIDSQNTFTDEQRAEIVRTIIQNGLNIAFNIEEIDKIHYIEQLFLTIIEHNGYLNIKKYDNYEVHFIFDLGQMEIRNIYRTILKIQNLRINYKLGLNISCLMENINLFKTLESQIKRLKFDNLFIDNDMLQYPYLTKKTDELLLRNTLQFKNLKQVLEHFDLENEHLILLNIENHKLLNDKDRDLSNSAPLINKTLNALYDNFDGFGLNIFDNNQANTMHLYDKNGFKTTLGLIFSKFLYSVSRAKYDSNYYSIIDVADYYCLVVYDWRVIEQESLNTTIDDSEIYINFKDNMLDDKYLIIIETFDENSGNINHLISKDLRDKYEWNTDLLAKVDNYFKPAIEIKEHDFSQGSLKLDVSFNALYVVKIMKKTK